MGLFDKFRSGAECPIDAPAREWVDYRWDWLEAEFGTEWVRQTPVILARSKYFPDPYNGTEDDARRLLGWVCAYMAIDPSCILMSLYEDNGLASVHPMFEGRRQGTAGVYHPEGDQFRIWIEAANLQDPHALVATMAHELGHVHLLGHGRISDETEDHEPLTDLLTVYFGLGVITANSVIREQYWHEGYYSGWKIGRQGYLTMPIFGYALARFARTRGENGRGWSKELRPDVHSSFKQSLRFLAAQSPDQLSDFDQRIDR